MGKRWERKPVWQRSVNLERVLGARARARAPRGAARHSRSGATGLAWGPASNPPETEKPRQVPCTRVGHILPFCCTSDHVFSRRVGLRKARARRPFRGTATPSSPAKTALLRTLASLPPLSPSVPATRGAVRGPHVASDAGIKAAAESDTGRHCCLAVAV
jgi:hypothetical protein